jgi:hypothetical protein
MMLGRGGEEEEVISFLIESAKLLGPIIKILLIGIKLHIFVCHLIKSILIRFRKYRNRNPLIYLYVTNKYIQTHIISFIIIIH